jgi:hypothetical protein
MVNLGTGEFQLCLFFGVIAVGDVEKESAVIV